MCAYVNVLSGRSVMRVWDCLFFDGPVVLFRIALALLKAIEGEIAQVMKPGPELETQSLHQKSTIIQVLVTDQHVSVSR